MEIVAAREAIPFQATRQGQTQVDCDILGIAVRATTVELRIYQQSL
jgi:hypothetical protein